MIAVLPTDILWICVRSRNAISCKIQLYGYGCLYNSGMCLWEFMYVSSYISSRRKKFKNNRRKLLKTLENEFLGKTCVKFSENGLRYFLFSKILLEKGKSQSEAEPVWTFFCILRYNTRITLANNIRKMPIFWKF